MTSSNRPQNPFTWRIPCGCLQHTNIESDSRKKVDFRRFWNRISKTGLISNFQTTVKLSKIHLILENCWIAVCRAPLNDNGCFEVMSSIKSNNTAAPPAPYHLCVWFLISVVLNQVKLKANFALPEPTQSPKSQKRQTRACPKPENLRLAYHWSKI